MSPFAPGSSVILPIKLPREILLALRHVAPLSEFPETLPGGR